MTEPENRPLTPANQNPWYVLMTLYGEQEDGGIDLALHEKNRAAWNAWAGQGMSEEERAAVAKSSKVTVEEMSAWPKLGQEIKVLHEKSWKTRNPDGPDWDGLPVADEGLTCEGVLFKRPLYADSFVFPAMADFASATFGGDAKFTSATFRGLAWFGSATFSGLAEFTSATFNTLSWFSSVTFYGEAWFNSANFKGLAWFAFTTFSGLAKFTSAAFGGETWLNSATFGGITNFATANFGGLTYFYESSFGTPGGDQVISLRDCHFAKATNFRDVRFNARYPDFQGAVLHPETTFTAKDSDEGGPFWPLAPADPVAAKESCSKIRSNLGKQGFPEDEHFFYRKEMRFVGLAAKNPVERIANWLFWKVSDYGYSFVRPIGALAALFAFGLVAYWGAFLQFGFERPLGKAIGLSFSNLFPYFGLARQYGLEAVAQDLPSVLKLVGGVQTVFGAVLLFLMALGLRTRFRMR